MKTVKQWFIEARNNDLEASETWDWALQNAARYFTLNTPCSCLSAALNLAFPKKAAIAPAHFSEYARFVFWVGLNEIVVAREQEKYAKP